MSFDFKGTKSVDAQPSAHARSCKSEEKKMNTPGQFTKSNSVGREVYAHHLAGLSIPSQPLHGDLPRIAHELLSVHDGVPAVDKFEIFFT